jgi:hypothetical protein
MEVKQNDLTKDIKDFDQLSSPVPRTILRRKTCETSKYTKLPPRRSSTTGNLTIKKVVFADKCKKPLKQIFEVPYILYDEKESPNKKIKLKGCQCIIY